MILVHPKGSISGVGCTFPASLLTVGVEHLTAFLCEPAIQDPQNQAIKQVILFIGAVLFKDQQAH